MTDGQAMMNSRRNFLKVSAVSMLALAGFFSSHRVYGKAFDSSAFTAGVSDKGREYIALCEGIRGSEVKMDGAVRMTGPSTIIAIDVETGDVTPIPIPIYGHIVNQNPSKRQHLVSFEKWGRQGVLVDMKDRKVLAQIESSPSNIFFGHCAFNSAGSIMLTTEDNPYQPHGKLVIRDALTLKAIESLDSFGANPHECRSPDGGKTVMVVNGGYPGADPDLSWVDLQSGKLQNQINLRSVGVTYSHGDISSDNWVCVSGLRIRIQPLSDLIVFISPYGEVLRPVFPKDIARRMKGEALSIAFLDNTPLVAVTLPLSNMMLVINYKTQTLVEAIPLKEPHGVLPLAQKEGTDFRWLVSLATTKMLTVDKPTGHEVLKSVVEDRNSNYCSHLSRIYI
jgi:hypothetical protein